MTPDLVVSLGKETVKMVLLVAAPMLGLGLVVGLIVSVLQAATQIQEMTLTFVPKIVAVLLALLFFFPWIMRILMDFTVRLYTNIPLYIQ
jgi:flagellar biosynthetic protein FliQ